MMGVEAVEAALHRLLELGFGLRQAIHGRPAQGRQLKHHTQRERHASPITRLPLQDLLGRERPANRQLLAHRAADEVALWELEDEARLQTGNQKCMLKDRQDTAN